MLGDLWWMVSRAFVNLYRILNTTSSNLVVSVFEATVYGSQTTGSTETQTAQNLGQTLGFGKQPHQIDLLQICDEITRLSWGHDFVTQKHRKPWFLPANIEINIAMEVGVQPWVTAIRGPRPCLRVSIREFSCPTLAARNDGDKRYIYIYILMQSNISLNNRLCSQVWTMVINYSSSSEMVWVLYITIPPIRCWVHTSLSLLNSSYYTLWATWLKATAVLQETSMGSNIWIVVIGIAVGSSWESIPGCFCSFAQNSSPKQPFRFPVNFAYHPGLDPPRIVATHARSFAPRAAVPWSDRSSRPGRNESRRNGLKHQQVEWSLKHVLGIHGNFWKVKLRDSKRFQRVSAISE